MYKEEAFSKAAKNDIYQMIENIKIAFQEMFKSVDFRSTSDLPSGVSTKKLILEHQKNNMNKLTWMDSPSKTAALEKFQKMKFKIGYPNYYDDDVTKLQRYMNYQVDMNDFYSNIERSTKLKVRLRMV